MCAPHSLANLSLGAALFHSELCERIDLMLLSHPVGSTAESIAQSVIGEKPDLCGFSSTTLTEILLKEVIRLIKTDSPDAIIVIGGPSIVYTDSQSTLANRRRTYLSMAKRKNACYRLQVLFAPIQ